MSAFSELHKSLQKPRPRALDKQDRDRLTMTTDAEESKKVKQRSGGQCEIVIDGEGRCLRKGFQVHHMLGGWGRRARGRSALAEHKQHACSECHDFITKHLLRLNVQGSLPSWTDVYTRWK